MSKPNPDLAVDVTEPPSETKVMRGIERAFEIAEKRAKKARDQAWAKAIDLVNELDVEDAQRRVMEWTKARYGNPG